MNAVRFFGPINNYSGYGNAVFNFAKAFSESSINTKFLFSNKASNSQYIKKLQRYKGPTNIDFYLHCPPYNTHKSNAYKIAYFYWEADRLPRNWVRSINGVDELWVPCNLVRDACKRAKFRGPIKVIPTPSDYWNDREEVDFVISSDNKYMVNNDLYKFYSIFQWQNRKNWITLLTSYYKAFSDSDNVVLILKVNPLNMGNYVESEIRADILRLKRRLNLPYYPPIFLSTSIVPTDSIRAIHNVGDCYVSPHHGEGWGMPIHDAMHSGNQIIVTKYGGVTEYLDDSSAHIIKHSLGAVKNMEWSPLYGSYQNWAYPSSNHLSKLFVDVYKNHNDYTSKAEKAKIIANSMTIQEISKIISKELSGGR